MVAQTPNLSIFTAAQKQHRQQIAWKIIIKAAHLLQEKYQVSKVMLFGSFVDSEKVRTNSDLDVAVWGLADANYYQALNDLQDLSREFSLDLVQFETAQPALQNKILNTGICPDQLLNLDCGASTKIMNHQYAVLMGQIRQELNEINNLVEQNQRLLQKLQATQDEDYLGTIALNLHSFYSGIERIFKQIAQTIDRSVPDTADWHRQLLRQMTASLPNIRSNVITLNTQSKLDDYCAFRHVVRNIYSINLKFKRVEELAIELPACFTAVQKDLETFLQTLAIMRPLA